MAKGGQGKGKAKGHSKNGGGGSYSSPSYPPSSISAPRKVTKSRVSYGQGAKYSYSKEGRLIMPSKAIKITNKGRRQMTMNTAYCMKCRKKVEMSNPKQVVMKNGRPATQGTCPVCGTKVFRIGK